LNNPRQAGDLPDISFDLIDTAIYRMTLYDKLWDMEVADKKALPLYLSVNQKRH
jgi:hypothetical protein